MSEPKSLSETTRYAQFLHFPAALWVLLLITAAVRLVGITRPLLGNFATKQAIYAMIARNWARGDASFWYPTLDVLRGGQRSWHLLDVPISAYLTGWLWKTLGGSLDAWGRATAAAFGTGCVALMFLLVRRRHGQTPAFAAAAVLALSPVSILCGHNFMLEASTIFFTLATIDTLDRWLDHGRIGWLLACGACFMLLLLTKVYMLVLVLPLGWALFRKSTPLAPREGHLALAEREGRLPFAEREGRLPLAEREEYVGESSTNCHGDPKGLTRGLAAAVLIMAMLPTAAWCVSTYRVASPGGPFAHRVYDSLLHSADVYRPPHPLLWSADFYRRMLDDLTGPVLTPVGFVLLLAGFLDRSWRRYLPWLLAMAVLVLAFPRKFYDLNYYYMICLPPLCIVAGLGWQVVRQGLHPGRAAVGVLLLVAMGIAARYTVGPAFVTPREDRAVLPAAAAVRELTAADEPVVTMHGSGIDLLYYCDRPGWAVAPDAPDLDVRLADCRRQGARYVAVVGSELPVLGPPVVRGEDFRIYRLTDMGR